MKLHWSQLTEEQKSEFENACGPGKLALEAMQFVFTKSSCGQHDFYYQRGGTLFDKVEADLMFVAYMVKDINDANVCVIRKLFYLFIAIIYFGLVSIFGCLFFKWGRYRKLREIIYNE